MLLLRSAEIPPSHEFGISVNRIAADARAPEPSIPVGLMKCVVPPGGSSTRHSHEDKELFFVAEGDGTITAGEAEFKITKGDVAILDAHEAHSVRNTSAADPLIFLSVYWIEKKGSSGPAEA